LVSVPTTGGFTVTKQAIVLLLCLIYVLFPIDLLPDVIPIAGWVDDIGAIIIGLKALGGQKKTIA
jgi:uncharacterized membrane protein YkvA (DUF1232 family)